MSKLKDLFLLDPSVIFLNHGSFGATPKPVFDVYQDWQREMERQPVKFLINDFPNLDKWARQHLGEYLNVSAEDVVFVSNATTAINIIARSLSLNEGDEVLSTNHEYGACDNIWSFVCQKSGASYKQKALKLPLVSQENIIEYLWEDVTPNTRLIFISHYTSPTAQQMPVKEIARRARMAGIISVIDGAHTPGQLPVDLLDIDADFYAGNLHKWALSPKGAGFLYCRKEIQHMIEPLIISWGWGEKPAKTSGSTYIDYLLWQGTRDPSASLAVPSAIEFQHNYAWHDVQKYCHKLLCEALRKIIELTGMKSLYHSQDEFCQMAIALLPNEVNTAVLKERLLNEFHIEVPIIEWEQLKLIRISVQGYNSESDIDRLVYALTKLLAKLS